LGQLAAFDFVFAHVLEERHREHDAMPVAKQVFPEARQIVSAREVEGIYINLKTND